jgi:hypothetical protein
MINGKKINLIDVSLNGGDHEEKEKYLRSVFYRMNIRHGNTVIEN